MMALLQSIVENYQLLAIAAGVFVVFMLCFMYYWLRILRGSQEVEAQRQQTRADMADVMLVFQTMRDVVQKQKALARDFNRELDHKTALVKRILQQSMEKNERLYEKQEALSQELMAARQELSRIKYQMNQAPHGQASQAPSIEKPATPKIIKPAPERMAKDENEVDPRLKNTGVTHAPAQSWQGEDLSRRKAASQQRAPKAPPAKLDFIVPDEDQAQSAPSATPSPAEGFQEIINELTTADSSNSTQSDPYQPDPEPALPGRQPAPESAKEAYRTLLNLPGENAAPAPATPAAPANGHNNNDHVRQQVVDYSRAGMPVAEIASELGIGKGEVRLILSLSQDTRA